MSYTVPIKGSMADIFYELHRRAIHGQGSRFIRESGLSTRAVQQLWMDKYGVCPYRSHGLWNTVEFKSREHHLLFVLKWQHLSRADLGDDRATDSV